jgi:hypothetical protein
VPAADAAERPRFDPEFALRFLKWREEKRRGKPVRGAAAGRPVAIEDARERIVRQIMAIKRQSERKQLEAGWTRDEASERMIPPGWVRVEQASGEGDAPAS